MIRLTGLDEAIIGIGSTHGYPDFLIYSKEKILEILMRDDEMTEEDALEHMGFNIEGGYFGEGNPAFMRQIDDDELAELLGEDDEQG